MLFHTASPAIAAQASCQWVTQTTNPMDAEVFCIFSFGRCSTVVMYPSGTQTTEPFSKMIVVECSFANDHPDAVSRKAATSLMAMPCCSRGPP